MSKPVLLSLGAGKVQELAGTANNDVLTWNSATSEWVSAAGGGGGGSGTVTSVGLTGGTSGIVIGGTTSPITTSGTYNLDAPQRFAFDTASPIAPTSPGQISWNTAEGSLNTLMAGGNVDAIVGQQLYQRAVNADTVTLTKGMVVYVFGSSGTRATVKRATADADLSSATILGVVAESIAQNAEGFIITNGLLKDLSVLPSTTFADGDVVYLSPTTAGGLTPTKPTAPQHLVMVGYCVKASNGAAGVLLVHPQNGYELGELHDVYINSPTSGQILIYDATTGQTRWENASLTGGTGVTVTPGPGSLSVAIGQDVGTTASVQFGSLALTTALPVTSGGTGVSSIASGQILYASGANTLAAGTLSSLSWSSVTPTSAISISPAGLSGTGTGLATTVTGGFRSDGTGGGLTLRGGNVTTGTGGATTITAGTATTGTGGAVAVSGGFGSVANGAVNIGTTTTSAVTIGATGITTTINGTLSLANALTVGNGGTGATTLTGYVKGNGASAMTASATVPTSDLSGTLPVANGGTGISSIATNQILFASSTNTLAAGTLSDLDWNGVNAVNAPGAVTFRANGSMNVGVWTATNGTQGYTTDIFAGPAANATGGSLLLRAGLVQSGNGNGGTAYLRGGAKGGTGTNGAVVIGDQDTSSVTIGATGTTTTVNGTLSLANALAVGSGGTGATSTSQNYVFAGPTSGSGAPSFRALVAGDIPAITTPYDLRNFFVGNPASSAVIDRFVADRAVTVSTTTTDHRFYCSTLPASGTVVLTVYKTPLAGSGKVAIFTATYTSGGAAAGNGLYAATIGTVSNNTLVAGDLVTVEVGTTQAAFATPVWTISATA